MSEKSCHDYLINNDDDDISSLYKQVDYLMEKSFGQERRGRYIIEWVVPLFDVKWLNIFLRNYYSINQ